MSANVEVSEDVKELIKNIIKKNNLNNVTDVKYGAGSETGDGYISRTISVDIINGKQAFRVFLKCASNVKPTEVMPINILYSTEVYFYDKVYPSYLKFVEERGVEDGFHHAPKSYGTLKNIVAMENLKDKGFTLFDRMQQMNDAHLTLTLKTFAKFHAVSFAYKDQKKEEYCEFVENAYDFFAKMADNPGFVGAIERAVKDFAAKLDPVEDKLLVDKCDGVTPKIREWMGSSKRNQNEYSILTQGDCWCNNMMFLYEKDDKETPSDIILIDWQVLRQASPVYDLSHFFYTIASDEALDNLHHYLSVYHEELSQQIRKLGSDPEKLYPLELLKEEWKSGCQYGFVMAFTFIKAMLSTKEEIVNLEEVDMEDPEQLADMFPPLKDDREYMRRMKSITSHLIKFGYI